MIHIYFIISFYNSYYELQFIYHKHYLKNAFRNTI